jgi:glucose-1-phosphate thymidylyltransferase
MMISCPEEIAYRLGYITSADLCRLADGFRGNEYGNYLHRLLEEDVPLLHD